MAARYHLCPVQFRVSTGLPWQKCQRRREWYLLTEKQEDLVKLTIRDALLKMGSFLVELDESIDLSEWTFFSNTQQDVPQQANLTDCGVYTCLFARCQLMVTTTCGSIPQFRKSMIIELQMQDILPTSSEDIM